MSNVTIILMAPQMGENIGAAARIMKNFALEDLRIVNPRDGWPNEKARSMAVGAVDIVDRAKIFNNLNDSIKDLEFLYATTSVPRSMNKEYITAQQLSADIQTNVKTGFLFGRESSGLHNDEIIMANKILTINSSKFNSLNIAQAVAIICYELFSNQRYDRVDLENVQQLSTKNEIDFLLEHLITELEAKNFFKDDSHKPQMIRNISNIFTRIDKLSKSEVQTLRGIITTLSRG